MPPTFRRPQVEAHEAVRALWATGHKNALVNLPTGVGKSICGLELVVAARRRGFRVLWMAHRRRLLDQAKGALEALWDNVPGKVGVIQANDNDVDADVVFAMIDTLRSPKRLEQYLAHGVPDFVVIDEVHHSKSASYQKFLETIDAASVATKKREAWKLGLTATVERSDKKELGDCWTKAYSISLLDAIEPPWEDEEPYLVPFVSRLCRLQGLVLPRTSAGGDFDDEELGHALMLAGVVEHTVKTMREHATGLFTRRPMVYCATVEQARETSKALVKDGWKVGYIDGDTEEDDRNERIALFENAPAGERHTLVNVGVLTEGTDIPRADCIVVARPTKSKPLYIQVVGRGLRLYPGKKDCLVIDIGGTSEEYDIIQAPVLLKDMEEERKARKKKPEEKKSKPDSMNAFYKGRKRAAIEWIDLSSAMDRRVFAVQCGEHGTIALVQDTRLKHVDLWFPIWIPKGMESTEKGKAKDVRPIEYLSKRPVDMAMAIGLGSDVARRASHITHKSARANWEDDPISDAQRERLFRFYVNHIEDLPDVNDMTKGEAQNLIDTEIVTRLLERKGLAKRKPRKESSHAK